MTEATLTSQDRSHLVHISRSALSFLYIAGKLAPYKCPSLAVRLTPKYGREEELQWKGNCCLSLSIVDSGNEILSAADFERLTSKPDTFPKLCSRARTFGVEIKGEVIKSSKSSANKAHL